MRELLNKRLFLQASGFKDVSQDDKVFVDMHLHSTYSDGLAPVSRIVDKARRYGFGIALTDHNDIRGAIDLSKEEVFFIPGIEVGGREGIHLVIYFYTLEELKRYYAEYVEPYKLSNTFYVLDTPTLRLIKGAKRFHCVISAAHPFGAGSTGMAKPLHGDMMTEAILEGIHALEIFNAGILKIHNEKAHAFARVTHLGLTGGSDGHTLREIGRAFTFASCPQTVSSFLDAVVDNESGVIGSEYPVFFKPYTQMKTLKNFATNPIRYGRHAIKNVRGTIRSRKES
jgi:PHP family Zn ribbon phosphoesterase